MDIHPQLKEIGLSPSEGMIYLYLLENGLSSPPQIAKGTKIARTNAYHVLQSLKEKGLVEEQTQGKRKVYLASDPEALARSLERKKEAVNRLLPDLRALYTTQKNKPKIQFYDGLKQIEEIYRQSLNAEEIFGIGSTKQLSIVAPDFYTEYLTEIKNRGIIFKDILSGPSKEKGAPEMQAMLKGLYDSKFIPQSYADFPTDILLWENKIALINLSEPVFGTILSNSPLAKTFHIIFDVLWKRLD